MMRYKQAEFEDDNASSIGSVALNSDIISTSATHIRYHSVSTLFSYYISIETLLSKCLLMK
jgi:membrane metallo-endopeptidase-like protein 1